MVLMHADPDCEAFLALSSFLLRFALNSGGDFFFFFLGLAVLFCKRHLRTSSRLSLVAFFSCSYVSHFAGDLVRHR